MYVRDFFVFKLIIAYERNARKNAKILHKQKISTSKIVVVLTPETKYSPTN